ncbi:MAG: peptidase M13 [Bifidobacteriaceae bacterium]|jgi:putative endopeptidase|nr:peptidase M13 [Bifidobacteriaceae bacterium]
MVQSGIVTDNIDPSIRPQDDLYRHVNGRWLEAFEIPPDRASDGAFRELRDLAELQTRQIIEDQAADSLVGALYQAFMDTDRIEALGARPLVGELRAIESAPGAEALARVMGGLSRGGVGDALGLYVDTDPGAPDRYVLNLHQAGIGLPDEAYYREDRHAHIRDAYREHIARMFALVADALPDAAGLVSLRLAPQEAAERVYAVERRLAGAHWDVVKDRDATATYNPMDFAGLRSLAPGFPWEEWAQAVDGPVAPAGAAGDARWEARWEARWDALVVMEPSFVAELAAAWRDVGLADWKLWAYWRVIAGRAALLNEELVEAAFDFSGRTLQGVERLRDRWKRGVSLVDSYLGELVGRLYVERHFPPSHKARMAVLVDDLIEAYRRSIGELDWLGAETKAKALAKLDAFTPKIGYPDKWRDYSGLRLRADDLIASVRAACAHETDRELRKLGGPVDRSEWFMNPQTVNAYYNPGLNEIVFPAAILRPPFFDAAADDAANYGGIGAVIGHEIGHGFDDQGSKYDGSGRLVDWWTDADRAAFEARTKALIAQYDAFSLDLPDGPEHVNGALTVGENIGDLGGLAIAWRAYVIALDRAGLDEGPVIDGLTAAQRFFFGWSQSWRQKSRTQQEAMLLAVDPHSPPQFRCNGVVSNLDAFYQAFDVSPGDGLYLPESQRVTIW